MMNYELWNKTRLMCNFAHLKSTKECLTFEYLGQYRIFMPVYNDKLEIWSGVTIAGQTNEQMNEQGKIELLSH